MLQFLSIYFILHLIVLSLSGGKLFSPKKNNKVALIICFILLGVLAAFRSEKVGNDTMEYVRIFNYCEDLMRYGTRFESGYIYFNLLIYKIYPHVQLLFIVISIFFYFTVGRLMWKYSLIPCLSLLLFFILSYGMTLSMIRQFMAMCILMYSFDAVIERKPIRFVLLVFLASQFHATAVVFLLAWFVHYIKIRTSTIIWFFIGAIAGYAFFADILSFAFSNVMFSSYEHYSEGKYFEGETRVASIVNLFFSCIIAYIAYYSYRRTDIKWRKSERGLQYRMFFLLQLIVIVINVMCLKANLLDRLGLYFSFYSCILLPNAIFLLPKDERKIIGFFLLFLFVSYSSAIIFFRPEWNRVYPIELVWGL